MSAAAPAVVTPRWLFDRLNSPGYKVLDATWYMTNTGKKAAVEFQSNRIPGSLFFDIDGVADLSSGLPHMLPGNIAFAAAMDALGIDNNTHVVLYDRIGMFSAPRAWWTFRVFGHDRVSVLEGGLPEWNAEGCPVDSTALEESAVQLSWQAAQQPPDVVNYKANLDLSKVRVLDDMLDLASGFSSSSEQVIDARSKGRFLGQDPEPRAGLPSGHMPGSKSVPFPSVLETPGKLKPAQELQAAFQEAGVRLDKPLVATCGSGLTACILALAVHEASGQLIPVYDGSWTEWALSEDTPKITSP